MERIRRIVLAFTTVALMLFVAGAAASAAQEPQAPEPIRGELVSVDTEARLITVKVTEEETIQFQYTDELKVTGAQETVGGLATAKNARVVVQFSESNESKVATAIEVQPAE